MRPPAFPGGTSVTRLSVYRDACRDGLYGGTPHLHTASTEAYVVVAGDGALQTVDMSGFQETGLRPGSTVWFTPGTIHRAINRSGLDVIVVMSNAGLPEAGDAVMTFPPEILADPARYRAAATLPSGAPGDEVAAAVRQRRDLAVEGFGQIVDAVRAGDFGPLERLYASAAALVRPLVASWRQTFEETVARQTRATAEALDALERGDGQHLKAATLLESPPSQTLGWGMCGLLRTHDVAHPVTHGTRKD